MRRHLSIIVLLVFAAYGCVTTKPATQPAPELLRGVASWYGEEFAGRTTANGEIFDPLLLTAAHRQLPFGTVVDVKNAKTGQTVRVRINDRGPYVGGRMIDLSYAAAQQIGLIEPGIGDVEVRVVKVGAGDREPPAPYEVTVKEQTPAPVVAPAPSQTSAPPVAFPLPSQTTAPAPAVVDRVEVIEERAGVPTRRQVSADGRTLEAVPVEEDAPRPAASLDRERVAAAPPPAPVRSSSARKQFFVQVGAFSLEENAEALRVRLTRIGQTAFIHHDRLYRVRMGPFATRDLAVNARGTLEANGVSAIIVSE
ncbi:MAG TPA: septal ring lytic transglycosylase RlpA family protein [Thermoanaerobaculia bacterium]